MIDKKNKLNFDEVFPQAKRFIPRNKEETIALAKKVSASLKSERQRLINERKDTYPSRFSPNPA
jgi:hypothetical protein